MKRVKRRPECRISDRAAPNENRMTPLSSTQRRLEGQANDAIRNVYISAGMILTQPVQLEAESEDYGACRFSLDGLAIVFRVAKTTPTKIGQFVTIWKRPTIDSPIAPLDVTDGVDFVVISVTDGVGRGHFIFSQKLLLATGVMSEGGKGGKRAIRVYPPWSYPTAKDAVWTQKWQTQRFLSLGTDGKAETAESVRKLFRV